MSEKLTCLACSHQMGNIMGDRGHQPDDGLSFHSHGHYGSAVFDPMDGSYVQIAICDRCLQRGIDAGIARLSKPDPASPYAT